jgi:hypothetical protein
LSEKIGPYCAAHFVICEPTQQESASGRRKVGLEIPTDLNVSMRKRKLMKVTEDGDGGRTRRKESLSGANTREMRQKIEGGESDERYADGAIVLWVDRQGH